MSIKWDKKAIGPKHVEIVEILDHRKKHRGFWCWLLGWKREDFSKFSPEPKKIENMIQGKSFFMAFTCRKCGAIKSVTRRKRYEGEQV